MSDIILKMFIVNEFVYLIFYSKHSQSVKNIICRNIPGNICLEAIFKQLIFS